jgi:hypothetical protein
MHVSQGLSIAAGIGGIAMDSKAGGHAAALIIIFLEFAMFVTPRPLRACTFLAFSFCTLLVLILAGVAADTISTDSFLYTFHLALFHMY